MVSAIGIFALLFGLMPGEFYDYQDEYSPISGQDQQVVDYFNAHNITLYQSTWLFNLTFSSGDVMEVLEDVPTTDHQIEFHGQQNIWGENDIHVRHAYPSWFFGLWLGYHFLFLTDADFATTGGYGDGHYPALIDLDMLEELAIDSNSSKFTVECDHLSMTFVIMNTGDYASLEDSWNNDEITVLCSYEIDWDAMKPSAFTLIGQLITFQDPDFGIPGDFGDIIDYCFGIGFWITVAIIIYTIVTRLIPAIHGGVED